MASRNSESRFFFTMIAVFTVFFITMHFFNSNKNSDIFSPKTEHLISRSFSNPFRPVQTPHPTPTSPSPRRKFSPVLRGNSCTTNEAFLSLKNVIKPPKISGDEFAKKLESFWRNVEVHELQLASKDLSSIIQKQIEQIQEKSCDGPNLQCGHQDSCGFGCQIHHRIACLMMSYITQLPLIHTPDCDRWPYDKRWSDVFKPLGSPCIPGNNTIVWKWAYQFHECENTTSKKTIPYPLAYGIPLDSELGDLIETITPTAFPWVVGQFAKYAMKLNTTFEKMLHGWKTEIGFDNKTPIVGIQVRRTDKILEDQNSRHSITVYMAEAEEYFQKLESSQGLNKKSLPRRLFLASDNSSLLARTVQRYPDWQIMGFASNFSETFAGRRYGLFEIVRDIELLSQANFVVCGFSSNICRLIYEMQAFQNRGQSWDEQFTSESKLKSLDGVYNYILLYHGLSPNYNMRIWKIDCD